MNPKCFEDVAVGDEIGPLVRGPMTPMHLFRWSAAIENWHRIHYDDPFAREVLLESLLLGLLGWAASARVICAGTRGLMSSEFVWLARASGFSGFKLLRLHVLPNLRGALLAQFWISVPVFIIAEANLGALGLGVSEPLPSLGSLLRELQHQVTLRAEPWQFLPLIVLIVVVSCFQMLLNRNEVRA